MPLAVVAIGGNALARADQKGSVEEQYANAAETCRRLVDRITGGWDLVLTHGNGPQVGRLLQQMERELDPAYRLPLDIVDADTQGGMGYMLQQVLGNELRARGVDRHAVTIITQVVVDAGDPAFAAPDKPIGPFFDEAEAHERMREHGWVMREDSGRGWRRLVASPLPLRVVEIDAVRACWKAGAVPIAAGGGGVPVVEVQPGRYAGVGAVIDKDRASALLARELGAELLVITTGVEAVAVGFGTPAQRPLREVDAAELRGYLRAGEFPAGSMAPKVEAALAFAESQAGRTAVITDAAHLAEAWSGAAGTIVRG